MDEVDVIIFVPVGTSIAGGSELPSDYSAAIQIVSRRVKELKNRSTPSLKEIFPKRANSPDPHPAEASSLYGFFEKKGKDLQGRSIEFILLHSPNDAQACAEGVKQLITDNNYLSNKPCNSKCQVNLIPLNDLDPKDANKFPKAIGELTDRINEKITGFSGEVYINITGGYKALLPYLTMIGMSLARVNVFYLFEDSPEIIMLPSYPLAFDLLEWRDWRGLLLPFTMDVGLTSPQKEQLSKALNMTKVAGLIRQEPPFELNEVGRLMSGLYGEEKGVAISEFGKGNLLLDRFTDKKYAIYLRDKCLPRWRHLSVGDHIPETVEHGRGHVQRLLELAQQLIVALDLKLTDEQLFVLISSIWLHDLGHSGDYFKFEGEDGLIQEPDNLSSTEILSEHDAPDWVRRYHSLLTYELLKTKSEFLFPEEKRPRNVNDDLLRSVRLACLYHRKQMPVQGEKLLEKDNADAKTVKVAKGIKDLSDVIEGFPLIAALLRFLDGAENQEERTGGENYYEVAQWVLKRQIAFMEEFNLDNKKIEFKKLQEGHFEEHRWIRHIFLVQENSIAIAEGIFGKNEDKVVGAYIIANPKAPKYCKDKVIRKRINPFLEEFLLVEDILPFRLALFLCEPDGNGKIRRYHVIPKPNPKDNDKVKPENWEYSQSLK